MNVGRGRENGSSKSSLTQAIPHHVITFHYRKLTLRHGQSKDNINGHQL